MEETKQAVRAGKVELAARSPRPRHPHHPYHGHNLLTIGEKCLHLICEVVRSFETLLLGSFRGSTIPHDSAIMLSRLSRTCRFMYVAVRNLPSVVSLFEPVFPKYPLPRGEAALGVAYWSDLAGIVWYVKEASQLLELAGLCFTEDNANASNNNNSNSGVNETKQARLAQLRKLFISIDWSSVLPQQGTDDSVWDAIGSLFHVVGGLSLTFEGDEDFHSIKLLNDSAEATPPLRSSSNRDSMGDNLRYFDVSLILRQGGEAHSLTAAIAAVHKFVERVELIDFSSIAVGNGRVGSSAVSMGALNGFDRVIFTSATAIDNLSPLCGSARYADIGYHHMVGAPFPNLEPLKHTHTVVLRRGWDIKDVSVLGGVHSLRLINCAEVTNLDALEGLHSLAVFSANPIANVSRLSNLHELRLTDCPLLSDVSALGGLHTIDLSLCPLLTDVRALGSVHTLVLYRCDNVSDVSALGGVHCLDISLCNAITDVSALGTVHTLRMISTSLSSVSSLGGVHDLYLESDQLGTDISALDGVHTLHLNRAREVSDLGSLGNVHTLTLSSMDAVTDVSALGTVHCLTLSYFRNLTDFSGLGGVHSLTLIDCNQVTDVSALATVHSLKLDHCHALSDVSLLGSVHTLTLWSCPRVTDVSALGTVHTLDLSKCPKISCLRGLSSVHTLSLSGEFTDFDVSPLAGVQRLQLTNCRNVQKMVEELAGRVPFVVMF